MTPPIAAQQSVVVPLLARLLMRKLMVSLAHQRSRQGFSTGEGQPLILPPNRKTI